MVVKLTVVDVMSSRHFIHHFLNMIDDLHTDVDDVKFVDDVTLYEVCNTQYDIANIVSKASRRLHLLRELKRPASLLKTCSHATSLSFAQQLNIGASCIRSLIAFMYAVVSCCSSIIVKVIYFKKTLSHPIRELASVV